MLGNFEGGNTHLGRGANTVTNDTLVVSGARTPTLAGRNIVKSDILVINFKRKDTHLGTGASIVL